MGRHKSQPNAECADCGKPFKTYGCIRCKDCRTGMNGTRKGGRIGWHICPVCGGKKAYAAKSCRDCMRELKKGGIE